MLFKTMQSIHDALGSDIILRGNDYLFAPKTNSYYAFSARMPKSKNIQQAGFPDGHPL